MNICAPIAVHRMPRLPLFKTTNHDQGYQNICKGSPIHRSSVVRPRAPTAAAPHTRASRCRTRTRWMSCDSPVRGFPPASRCDDDDDDDDDGAVCGTERWCPSHTRVC